GYFQESEIMREIAKERIVIAGREANARAALSQLQQPRQHAAEDGPPMPSLFQSPAVDDIANQVQILWLNCVEQREQRLSLRVFATQMHIAEKDASQTCGSPAMVHGALVQIA